jgi:hypothetical protein
MLVRFTLTIGEWFGLTMFPGYGDCPYHSPIRVDGIEPLGNRQFKLTFLNLAYASGVQNFEKILRTLRRGSSHLMAEETEVEDRTYVLTKFNSPWVLRHFPDLHGRLQFDATGRPAENTLLRL